jgi:hypothetical protein
MIFRYSGSSIISLPHRGRDREEAVSIKNEK